MQQIKLVARDLITECFVRRYILVVIALFICVALAVYLGVNSKVVKGVIAFNNLTGSMGEFTTIQAKLMPLLGILSIALFHSSITFSIITIPDLILNIFKPERVLFQLTLPVRRYEIVAGIFVGGLFFYLLLNFIFYGITAAIIYSKFTLFPHSILIAALLNIFIYAPILAVCVTLGIYGVSNMITMLSGFIMYFCMFLSSYYGYAPGATNENRTWFGLLLAPLPRIERIQDLVYQIAIQKTPQWEQFMPALAGCIAFTICGLLAANYIIYEKDF